ncbi:hypothetical protein NA78x_001105 [Anatilimnocola sp. NA78]|uniref:hypothetical protein n=1 Tax=Anatilimnocola sp. NA78 TaxID=3415683 RepID=UPI003CE52207
MGYESTGYGSTGYAATESVGDSLYPRGFRKTLAMVLFFVTATLPSVVFWQSEDSPPQPHGPVGFAAMHPLDGPPSRAFGPGPRSFGVSHRHSHYGPAANDGPSLMSWVGTFFRWSLAFFGGIFSLALYYPRWGFKRFALLCGPIAGLGAMMALAMYLFARTEVYRFEIVFASMFGALPGILLYALLVYAKASRLANQDQAIDAPVFGT